MDVSLGGRGPAVRALSHALSETEATVRQEPLDSVADPSLSILVADVADEGIRSWNRNARSRAIPAMLVEIGGVGGLEVSGVDAAVSGFAPTGACYDCLCRRVQRARGSVSPSSSPEPGSARLAGAMAGQRAVRLLEGDTDRPGPLGYVEEIPQARHRLLPVPDCECRAVRDHRLRKGVASRSVEASIEAASPAVDDRVGILTEVAEIESFPAPYYLGSTWESEWSATDGQSYAAGVATGWDRAYMKAIGEGLERYAAATYAVDRLETAPARASGRRVPPSSFVTSEGVGDVSAGGDRWVRGESLQTGERVWLPAEFVFFPPPAVRHRPSITTGLGLGTGGGAAILAGLYEIVERDAAMLAWYSSYEPLELTVDSTRYRELARRIGAESLRATPLLLTQDIDIPVVAVAVHRRDGDWPRFALGVAANLDAERAASAALEEAVQNHMELARMGEQDAERQEPRLAEYARFPEPARALFDAEASVPAAAVGLTAAPEGRAELETVLDRVEAAEMAVYGSRLTTPDIEPLGFEAVRILAPAAQPLFTDRPYFGERASRVPAELGFEPTLDREPHPFP